MRLLMDAVLIVFAKYLVVVPPVIALAEVKYAAAGTRKTFILRALIAAVIAFALAKVAGALFIEPRPFVTLHRSPLIPHEPDTGMPSDHVLVAVLSAMLAGTESRWWGLVAGICAVLVAVGRVGSLLHTPLDVVASTAFAAISVGIACLTIRPKKSSAVAPTPSE